MSKLKCWTCVYLFKNACWVNFRASFAVSLPALQGVTVSIVQPAAAVGDQLPVVGPAAQQQPADVGAVAHNNLIKELDLIEPPTRSRSSKKRKKKVTDNKKTQEGNKKRQNKAGSKQRTRGFYKYCCVSKTFSVSYVLLLL